MRESSAYASEPAPKSTRRKQENTDSQAQVRLPKLNWDSIYQGHYWDIIEKIKDLPDQEKTGFIEKLQDKISFKYRWLSDREDLAEGEWNDPRLAEQCRESMKSLGAFEDEINKFYQPEDIIHKQEDQATREDTSTLDVIRTKINNFLSKKIL